MRELSLHIMDLIENSLRAQATIILVSVEALPDQDLLRIVVEDNGTGLRVPVESVLDPFYTTKRGKRTGLGLSLFRAAAESTGGRLMIDKSALGDVGVRVTVELGLTHIDRNPLGDLAGTLAAAVCTNPAIDFRIRLGVGARTCELRVWDLATEAGVDRCDGLALARVVRARVQAELQSAAILT
ncbi:MAG TPA: ATP-binding protein [Phycisphaerae bacterium]|nr:ATP-binding protein [Phycisphaerae bacterium]HPM24706.1 ATP-binding protein [Phycisphaerae bacterium]